MGEIGEDDCYLRIIVTRGAGEISLCPPTSVTPSTVVIAAALPPWPPAFYDEGISLVVVGIRRNLRGALNPMIKSGNYLNNILATLEARKAGAVDAIMLNAEGHVTESSTANVFIVKEGTLITPPEAAGILDGVSRHTVLELARREGMAVRLDLFDAEALREADECFLTSTTRDVMPVNRVDDATYPAPGPLTRRIMKLFREFTRRK